jgi:hypothetical protein
VSVENFSATADVPRVRVHGARSRFVMIAAVFVIPLVAVALALAFRATAPGPPLQVRPQPGSYQATAGTPLSVTGFRISNHTSSAITIARIRFVPGQPDLDVIGALAFRGCARCVTSTSVPPRVTAPPGIAPPKLLPVTSFTLKPGAMLTLVMAVKVWREVSTHVPQLRIDTTGPAGKRTIETTPGPGLCAAKAC